ncbi:MAG: hypothetical protein V2A79_01345 [Planctomycetota bacterium]
MAIRLKIEGCVAECDTAEEAAAFHKLVSQRSIGAPATARRGRPPSNGHVPHRLEKKKADLDTTLAFLRVLASKPAGIASDALVETLKLRGPRGIGGALMKFRRVVIEHNFSAGDAFRMVGVRADRRWKPGKQIESVMATLGGSTGGDA